VFSYAKPSLTTLQPAAYSSAYGFEISFGEFILEATQDS